MSEERGSWYLLTGLLLGIALGIVYAWVISPAEYVDTAPDSLQVGFKDRYRALIAAAYLANSDLVRASARLELLGDMDVLRTLNEQAQRTLAENKPEEARALAILALAMDQGSSPPEMPANPPLVTATFTSQAVALPLETNEQATPGSDAPAAQPAGEASAAASEGEFILFNQTQLCDMQREQPILQIQALDAGGQPVPGLEVVVSSAQGEERFLTGLKPEMGLGYADITLTPGVTYTLRLGENSPPVTGIAAVKCDAASGMDSWAAWLLRFQQR